MSLTTNEQIVLTFFDKIVQQLSEHLINLGYKSNHNLCIYKGCRLQQVVQFLNHLKLQTHLNYHSLKPLPRYLRRNSQIINEAVKQSVKLKYQKSDPEVIPSLKDIAIKLNQAEIIKFNRSVYIHWEDLMVKSIREALEGQKGEFQDYGGLNDVEFARVIGAYIELEGIKEMME